MTQTEQNQNFQMIHIASELVALIGVTFYFTSKYNSLNQDIKNMQNIVQQQHAKIQLMDKQIKELYNLIQKFQPNNLNNLNNPIINESFKDPADVLAQMMGAGVHDIIHTSHSSHSSHTPHTENSDNTSNIEIIETVQDNSHEKLETASELDNQLAQELSELHESNKNNSEQQVQPPIQTNIQPPIQSPIQPPIQSNIKSPQSISKISTSNDSSRNKIQPIHKNNILIDFSNLEHPKKSPSNNSQLSVQDDAL